MLNPRKKKNCVGQSAPVQAIAYTELPTLRIPLINPQPVGVLHLTSRV